METLREWVELAAAGGVPWLHTEAPGKRLLAALDRHEPSVAWCALRDLLEASRGRKLDALELDDAARELGLERVHAGAAYRDPETGRYALVDTSWDGRGRSGSFVAGALLSNGDAHSLSTYVVEGWVPGDVDVAGWRRVEDMPCRG